MNYNVDPGLYALGNPDSASPVLVSANYKLSFDRLRKALPGFDAWILVLDTKGVNVWCAAGKGTFGTGELVHRVDASGLSRIVSHNRLTLPQLAAPGIAAHQVGKISGFNVVYGPVRAEDLRRFITAGYRASPRMRVKAFPLLERLVLIPVELVAALKASLVVIAVLFLLSGLLGPQGFVANLSSHGLLAGAAVLTAVFFGAVVTPILLPWLPGRAFSLKGLLPGLAGAGLLMLSRGTDGAGGGFPEMLAWFLLVPALASYLAMNFTGASTYTSLSGVKKEMRRALPVQIGAGVLGLSLWIYALSAA